MADALQIRNRAIDDQIVSNPRVAVSADDSAGGAPQIQVGQGLANLRLAHTEGLHAFPVEFDPQFGIFTADHLHVSHPFDGEQRTSQAVEGEAPDLRQRHGAGEVIGKEAARLELLGHIFADARRQRAVRQILAHQGELFVQLESGEVHVGAAGELDLDLGLALGGGGPHFAHPADRVGSRLDR